MIGSNNSMNRASCSPKYQKGIPTGTVNNKSASFLISFLHKNSFGKGPLLIENGKDDADELPAITLSLFLPRQAPVTTTKKFPCSSNQPIG